MSASTMNLKSIEIAFNAAKPVLREQLPEQLEEYEALWQEKSGTGQKPAIMLYGMYSHGKSTLLNALLGREEAAIGIAPTTDVATEYFWEEGNCIIIDTPGIQAKERHTSESQTRLRKCELVAFVVQSGQFEEAIVWDELAKIVSQNQKVCLIINDFDDYRSMPDNFERLKDAFRIHIQDAAARIGYQGNIVSQVPFLLVNAKTALKAKLENKPPLLTASNLPAIEKTLMELAASFDMTDSVNTLRRNLHQLIVGCQLSLANKGGDTLLAEAEDSLAAIKRERDRAFSVIEMELENKIAALSPQFYAIYENSGADKGMIEQHLIALVDGLVTEMTTVVEEETKKSAIEVQNLCDRFGDIRRSLSLEGIGDSSNDNTDPEMLQKFVNLDWSSLLKDINWETAVKDATVFALKELKEWFPSLLKGIGPVTMGKWGATLAKALGAVVTAGAILFQLYSDYQAEEKARNQAQRRAQAIADAVAQTQKNLAKAFITQIQKIFVETFDKMIAEFSANVKKLRQQSRVSKHQQAMLEKAEELLRA